jgi:prophage regulatory protein
MQPRFIRVTALASHPARGDKPARPGRYPVSTATIWRWVKDGKFPPPVKLGAQTTAWPVALLDQWDAEQAAEGREVSA